MRRWSGTGGLSGISLPVPARRMKVSRVGAVVGWRAHAAAWALRTALLEAGVALVDEVPPGGPLVLVTDDDATAPEEVRQAARLAPGRVLAIFPDRFDDAAQWALLDAGAADVLAAGSDVTARVVARLKRWAEVDARVDAGADRIVGRSAALIAALRTVVEAAMCTDAPILIQGGSGTGKELLATLAHEAGRAAGELVLLDCSTVVEDLAGSEFFGHERGAYTGAVGAREGAFARADGGTLFLDEIGELPLTLQPELLRAVQERAYKRVGGNTWRRTSFRLICATNRDLPAEVAAGRFREDLYFRIAAWTCRVPDLGERRTDILPLARHFLREAGVSAPLSSGVAGYLQQRCYAGNVRELRQLVQRMAARHTGPGDVTLGDVPPEDRPPADVPDRWPDEALRRSIEQALAAHVPLPEITRSVADLAVALALEESGGRTAGAAALLQVSPRAVQQRRADRHPPAAPG
jgi:transcriptional regulator with GAF, ATPase, and Fis domain